jgi:N-acyl-D-amino-acid deacylase
MSDRLVVRGGTVVDGTGMPAFTADVEVTNGRITRVGRLDAGDARVIEADGLVVAPGFIDLHTHYDAQLHFEPTASPSSWHGVTTVVIGNCGFSLAPSKPDDVAWTARMLSRVEGMSEDSLLAGVT